MPDIKDIILGNVAVERGLITREQLADLQRQQKDANLPLGQMMLRSGVVSGSRLIELMKLVNVTIQHLDGGMEVGVDDGEGNTNVRPAPIVDVEPAPAPPPAPDGIPVAPVYGSPAGAGPRSAPAASANRPVSVPGAARRDEPTPRPIPPPSRPSQQFDPNKIVGTSTPPIQASPVARAGNAAPGSSKFDAQRFDAPASPPPSPAPSAQASEKPPSAFGRPGTARFAKPAGPSTARFGSSNMKHVIGGGPASRPPAVPPAAPAPAGTGKPATQRFAAARLDAGQQAPAGTGKPATDRFTAADAPSRPGAPGTGKPATQRFVAAPPAGQGAASPPREGHKPKTEAFNLGDLEPVPKKPATEKFDAGKANKPKTEMFQIGMEPPPKKPATEKLDAGKANKPKTEMFQIGLVADTEKPAAQVQGTFGESVAAAGAEKKDKTRLYKPVELPNMTPAGKLPSDDPDAIVLPAVARAPDDSITPAGILPKGIDRESKPLVSPLEDAKAIPGPRPAFEMPPGAEAVKAEEPPVVPAGPPGLAPASDPKSPGRMMKPEDSGFMTASEIPDFEVRASDGPGGKPVVIQGSAASAQKGTSRQMKPQSGTTRTSHKPAGARPSEPPATTAGEAKRASEPPKPGPAARPAKPPLGSRAGVKAGAAKEDAVDDVEEVAEEPKKKGKKLLVTLLVLMVLILGGGGALFHFKKLTVEDMKRLPEAFKAAPELLKESPRLVKELFKK